MYHFLCWDSERSKFYVTEELFYLEIRKSNAGCFVLLMHGV